MKPMCWTNYKKAIAMHVLNSLFLSGQIVRPMAPRSFAKGVNNNKNIVTHPATECRLHMPQK